MSHGLTILGWQHNDICLAGSFKNMTLPWPHRCTEWVAADVSKDGHMRSSGCEQAEGSLRLSGIPELTFQLSFLSSAIGTSLSWPLSHFNASSNLLSSRFRNSVPSFPYNTYPLVKPGAPPVHKYPAGPFHPVCLGMVLQLSFFIRDPLQGHLPSPRPRIAPCTDTEG